MKYEWRKEEKQIYSLKRKPILIKIPKFKYFCIKGKGNPNGEDFSNRIGVLYSLAYAVRMMPRNGFNPVGYFEYTVYPLEGTWDLTAKGRSSDKLDKEELIYTIMIRQPDFVDDEVVKKAFELVSKKKPNPLLKEAYFDEIEDGDSVQMMHLGSYDKEKESFDIMKKFIDTNSLKIKTLVHREIYLSDFRRTAPEKLKTILRYKVEKKK